MIGGSSSILELNIPLFSNAIQRIGNNLTRLKLEIPWVTITSSNITIKLMSLLDTCPNLIQLTYKLKNLESDDMDGDIQPLTGSQKQYPLMELELYLHRTTRDVMEPLLKCCHRLQRLMLWNCMEDFMDLVDMYCPYLQILSYNTEEYEVMKLDKIKNYNGTVESSGLRALYGLYRFPDANSNPFWRPLSFIERNAATLDEITIWGIPDFREANGFLTNTQLPNLRKLRIPIECEDNNPIVNQLLRYIPTCSALTTLQVGYCETLPKLVDSLIELQRPLQTLELQLLHKRELHNNEDERSLLRLFQYYASTTTVTTSFEKITLFEAGDYYILTDKILDALSDIKTLTEVDVFSLSPKISGQGLQLFFNKLSATKVTHVNLGNLTNCLDEHIITLAKSLQHSLTHIQLDALINITEYSILFLIQKAIHLNQITVNFCIYIDDNEILVQHAKEKNIKYTVT
ncbi:hypothetical protein BDA99DRAFT_508858 [Phascolomyces articulosus]|uniref:Uncharacterized protein n=1 Tax=Phascolomyces articulosus TaxID=60185 RepID=A0AAD5PEB7_9FUNG|nr:hypothetical protein BDA99DRAFT_508858 [Phascolomyces articulosus]